MAEASTFYDALTEAMSQPYPEAAPRLAEIAKLASSDQTANPMVRTFIPALDRSMFVRTRGEAARLTDSTAAPERWVTGSNSRIDSISSPKKSSRYGWVAVTG